MPAATAALQGRLGQAVQYNVSSCMRMAWPLTAWGLLLLCGEGGVTIPETALMLTSEGGTYTRC